MKHFLTFLLICTLAGCVNTANKMTTDVDTLKEPNLGYALIGLQSRKGFKSLLLNGEEYVRLDANDINQSSTYLLIPLKAGTYNFYRVEFNLGYTEFNTDSDYWEFTVTPGTVNYVGHLKMSGRSTFGISEAKLVNHSSNALEFMEQEFPNILESRQIVYGGPGEDNFYDFIRTLPDMRNKAANEENQAAQGGQ